VIQSASVVLALMIAGEAIAACLNLPLPCAALGLLTLSTIFALRGAPDRGSEKLLDVAAPYFPLCFMPAAVGVIGKADMLAGGCLPVVVAVRRRRVTQVERTHEPPVQRAQEPGSRHRPAGERVCQ
jgi:putative effector of murein hydrolase LrgA (UPF0299 family)